jgi:hypothetical protein
VKTYRKRNWTFMKWEPEEIVHGECATLVDGDRELELVITKAADKTFFWEVLDDANAIAAGFGTTRTAARHAAETAARRALMRAV